MKLFYTCMALLAGSQAKNCLSGQGRDYDGRVSNTRSGFTCMRWTRGYPHIPNMKVSLAIRREGVNNYNHNFCRNPGGVLGQPWCYTTNPRKRYDYCELPACGATDDDDDNNGRSGGTKDCLSGIGTDYKGKVSTTLEGSTCINWLEMKVKVRKSYATRVVPDSANHNYCRNYDKDPNGPWCYINMSGEYKFCDIPKCGSDENGRTKPQIEEDDGDEISPSACGYKNVDGRNPRIVGGEVADKGEWPWQVHLRKYGSGFCGGSIINEYFVLTAAHCADRSIVPDKRELNIAVGWNFHQGTSRSITAQDRARGKDYIGVRNIFVHPKWRGANSGTITDDIALIQLERPVRFVKNGLVRPVCLPSKAWDANKRADDECTATGWGATENYGDPSNPAPQKDLDSLLLEVELDAQDGARPGYPGQIGGKAPKYFRSGVCFGDSGGPFVCSSKRKKERQVQVGISSYVMQGTFRDHRTGYRYWSMCGNDTPSMFTKVSQYLDWIKGYAGEVQIMDGNGNVIG